MKKVLFPLIGLGCLILLPLQTVAKAYRSLNRMCVVEKRGNDYWFLNEKEFTSKSNLIFDSQRNQYEWFFVENGEIQAKVYPALRDAIIASPSELYVQKVGACKLLDTNQRLARSVSYKYKSKDVVCAAIFEGNELKLGFSVQKLKSVPYEEWVLFFTTEFYPRVITGIVPKELAKAWNDVPDEYIQKVTPCENSTGNEAAIKELSPQMRK